MSLNTRQNFGGHIQSDVVHIEESSQHGLRGSTDGRVGSGVGGIIRSFPYLGQPVWVGLRLDISVGIGRTNRGDGAPEVVGVLGVIEGNYRVRQRQSAKSRALCAVVKP